MGFGLIAAIAVPATIGAVKTGRAKKRKKEAEAQRANIDQ